VIALSNVEDVIAEIEEKVSHVSGRPPDLSEQYAKLRGGKDKGESAAQQGTVSTQAFDDSTVTAPEPEPEPVKESPRAERAAQATKVTVGPATTDSKKE
jgi:hypothetical protein